MKKLILDPDPRLRKICVEITSIDNKITKLANDMLSFVRKGRKNDIVPWGLAAPQFGELVRLFVIDTPNYSLVMINPSIVKTAGSHKVMEQCLSLPGRQFVVERPKLIKFQGLDLEGRDRSVKLHDTYAQVAEHEIQHLFGIMLDNIKIMEVPSPGSQAWKTGKEAKPL